MFLTREKIRHIHALSDTKLYEQALAFFQEPDNAEREHAPLSNAQINGLLNIVQASTLSELLKFVEHQHKRNWNDRRICIFYEDLEKIIKQFRVLALQEGLLSEGRYTREEENSICLLLAREFIQHLAAENLFRRGGRSDD